MAFGFVLWSAAALTGATTPGMQGAEITLNSKGFNSAKVCGHCHREIYDKWKQSMHASSVDDPIFNVAFLKTYWRSRGKAAALCLRCHAPTTQVTGDFDANLDITSEGVTCDFCHSVSKLNLAVAGEGRFEFTFGVKHGPRDDLESPVHQVKSSELFRSSEMCAGCHEWKNERGVNLLSTYSEWSKSSYAAEGRQCQSCHMPEQSGSIVDPSVKTVKSKVINSHDLSGGHSVTQVKQAIRVEIKNLQRQSGIISFQVEVRNVGSGHSIPTGMPTRTMVLSVTALTDRKPIFERSFEYRKEVVDATGKLLTDDMTTMLDAALIRSDSRIPPGGAALESVSFPAPDDRDVAISAIVTYRYAAELLKPEPLEIEMGAVERIVRRTIP